MENIKDLGLTTKDFDMLVEGLECLPEKSLAGELMVDILMVGLSKDPAELEKLKADRQKEKQSKERAKDLLKEEVRILQGKILGLKRALIESGLLKQAKEVLE